VACGVLATSDFAQSARDIRGGSPYVAIENEPAPRLIVDPPLPEGLAQGVFWAQYRVENLRIVPVFGPGAVQVSPRVGHLHVVVDDLPWWWADASDNNTVDIAGLPPGQHKVRIELVDGNHNVFPGQVVTLPFIVPRDVKAHSHHASNPQPTNKEGKNMTAPNVVNAKLEAPVARTSSEDTSIRPFRVRVSDEALADLRRRIEATRWPERETVDDQSQGVQLATIQKLARYWSTEYDWRKCEAKLNALPQFVTTIDGLDIHFIHVKSRHPNALPMIITHGWPGSIIELLKVIDPLTNPTAHGGSASDAFDVVIPSLPGFGFSGKPATTGWDPPHIARAWTVLMKRLGYTRFVAQGGDWGAMVTDVMGTQAPSELLGIHLNWVFAVPPDIDKALQTGSPLPSDLSADERRAAGQLDFFYKHGVGYALEMSNRPQTIYGIGDSPVGLAAWLLDHDALSHALIARVFEGEREGLTRDDVLDNITLYWLTNTTVSSARIYWENKFAFFAPKHVAIPVAVSAFPDEVYQVPQSWAERAYPKLIYYNRLDKGGHFAAWEQPELFTSEVRAAFRSLRPAERASR
jgi:pimeloyl-ACP methyl ester carboxylesterase